MTLHAAMKIVLAIAGRPLSAGEIADAINNRQLYVRGDGHPVPSDQIRARARKYAHLFDSSNGELRLALDGPPNKQPLQPVDRRGRREHLSPMPIAEHTQPNSTSIEQLLLANDSFQNASAVDHFAPNSPGLYAIRLSEMATLPSPFQRHVEHRQDRLIYIGEAKASLRKRLVNQELRAKGHGTFFRSIGAVLGYRPERGSLIGRNTNWNYVFGLDAEEEIVQWINRNLEVSWVVLDEQIHETEVLLIHKLGPLFNLTGNPRRLPELTWLRRECLQIANDGT